MSTADFSNKLMTFKMEPLTLHSGKSTPGPGPHRSSAVLISHPLQAPWLQPNHHGQFRVSSDLQPDDHTPPQARLCLLACLPHGFLLCRPLSLQPSIEDGVSDNPPGVILKQWMGLSESHPPGRVLGDICVLLKRSWQT